MVNGPEIKLEKKIDAKLDDNDRDYLSGLKAEDLQKRLQTLKDEKFDLSVKNKGVRLEDIIKNYNTATKTIELKGEKIAVKNGSDLAAWIQILMVADGRNIKPNDSKYNLGLDGSIGDTTGGAIDDYKGDSKTNTGNTNNIQSKNNVELPDTLTLTDINAIKNVLNRFIFEPNLGAQIISFMVNAKILTAKNQLNSYMYSIDTKSPYMIKFTVNNDHIKNKVYTIPLTSLLNPRSKNASTWDIRDDAESTIFSKFKDVYKDNNANIAAEKLGDDKETLSDFEKDWIELKTDYANAITYKGLTAAGKINVCRRYANSYKELKEDIMNSTKNLKSPTIMKPKFLALSTTIDKEMTTTIKTEELKAMAADLKNSLANLKKANGPITDMPFTTTLSSYQKQLNLLEGKAKSYKAEKADVDGIIKEITTEKENIVKMQRYLSVKKFLDDKTQDLTQRYNKKMTPAEADKLRLEIKTFQSNLEKGIYYPTFKKYASDIFAEAKALEKDPNKAKSIDYAKYISTIKNITKNFS